jgi:hypothetical protein
LFGDPIDRLRTALIAAEPRMRRRAESLSLREVVEMAVGPRVRKGEPPLLLVIDQFEEFLILNKGDQHVTFAAFLTELIKQPIEGLRLLLVFRSDYRPLIFKFDLPPLVANHNWIELAPYDRDDAMKFLRGGGRELSPETGDRLFRGLDRIESAPGMYRLITLNMVGLVLERMGRRLESDPGRLIQSYLTACLKSGETRDFTKRLLAQMITEAGTKEPRTEPELVIATGFAPWQVKATLAELARQGLVRQLNVAEATWEIAHDFLARLIGQLIGRLKPGFWQRLRPLVAPMMLIVWIVSVFVAWPYLTVVRQNAAEADLRQLGASFSTASPQAAVFEFEPQGLIVTFEDPINQQLESALPFLETLNASTLKLVVTSRDFWES